MLALFFFGTYTESRVGRKKFLLSFFVGGILGNLVYFLISPYSTIPAVGASGGIYSVIGFLAILEPTLIVYINFVPMPLIFAAILWIFLSLTGMLFPSQILHEAHLTGLLFGIAYGYLVRRKRRYRFFYRFEGI